ncbi:hypothetical protein Pla100_43050 [Neorhodopirellula pilleata]|uniref:Uncharacterized protein n=1 Tax=Neorhodopirellula pilleata TaxID=2714738 RepID=A0A5C6A092_9BACT|nr:hypothetical protein Pla100_43050 [Neorhodopirellula pilleata]
MNNDALHERFRTGKNRTDSSAPREVPALLKTLEFTDSCRVEEHDGEGESFHEITTIASGLASEWY